MAILMPQIIQAKQVLKRSLSNGSKTSRPVDIPKGYFVVYIGEHERKHFVAPISLLNHPSFQELLQQSEEEFGYVHPMGGLTTPCCEDTFTDLSSSLGTF